MILFGILFSFVVTGVSDAVAIIFLEGTRQEVSFPLRNFSVPFPFRNDQNKPLIILSVSGGDNNCSASFPKEPIFPGKRGSINISCDGLDVGFFGKTFSVSTNQGESNLSVSGFMDPPPNAPTSPPLPLKDRLEQMKKICLDRDWSKEKCRFGEPIQNQKNYTSTASRYVGWRTRDGIRSILSEGKRFIDKYVSPIPGSCSATSIATHMQDTLLEEVEATLRSYAAKNKLTECAKACLATCASSQLIRYNIKTQNALEYQPAYILTKGEGLCRHYSYLADGFMSALGIPSTTLAGDLISEDGSTDGHAWISVKIKGKRYWMEPQSSACEFMRTD